MKFIKELNDGDADISQFLISDVTKGVTNNGLSYLNIEFKDCTGTIIAKKWNVDKEDEDIFKIGNIVQCHIEVLNYKGNLQAKVIKAHLVKKEDIDYERFIKKAPLKYEELMEKFNFYVSSIKDENLTKVLNYILTNKKEKLFIYPAGVTLHHEYRNGLLYHTVSMCSMADYVCSYYTDVDRDLLITAALLHDVGKTEELEGDLTFKYSVEGKLLGHIAIGASLIREAKDALNINDEKIALLEHMILSHHGQLEFGSPVLPQTKEAIILSLIDNLDSKIALVDRILDETKPGEFSAKVFALDNRCIYKPKK